MAMKWSKVRLEVQGGQVKATITFPEGDVIVEYMLGNSARTLWLMMVAQKEKGEDRGEETYLSIVGARHYKCFKVARVTDDGASGSFKYSREVTRITKAGTMYIGCGKVTLAEVSKIAKQLGWRT